MHVENSSAEMRILEANESVDIAKSNQKKRFKVSVKTNTLGSISQHMQQGHHPLKTVLITKENLSCLA